MQKIVILRIEQTQECKRNFLEAKLKKLYIAPILSRENKHDQSKNIVHQNVVEPKHFVH